MRVATALAMLVAFLTAVCPLRTCFDGHGAAPAAPGNHGHEDHEGPDRDAGCCVDVPRETGGPWVVVHLDVPVARWAEALPGPRTPSTSASPGAPRVVPARSTVLLR